MNFISLPVLLMLCPLLLCSACTEPAPPEIHLDEPLPSVTQQAVELDPNTEIQVTEAIKTAVVKEIYKARLLNVQPAELIFRPSIDMYDVYETQVGAYVFQVSSDASLLLRGDLFYTEMGEALDARARAQVRRDSLALLDERDMIIFPAHGEIRHELTAFVDVECEFCAKLQNDMPRLNAQGVRVRFLAFPREGTDSRNYRRTVSVWCSDNRAAALARVESGHSIPSLVCENPVEAQFHLGEAFRVEGTPTLILANGYMRPGYPGFTQLLALLEQHSQNEIKQVHYKQ